MKALIKIHTSLFIIFLVILTSCIKETETFNENGLVIIAGKALNHEKYPDNYTVKVFISEYGTTGFRTHIAFIDKRGNFVFKFDKYHPQDIFLKYGKMITLYISPGDSLYLEFDADEFNDPDQEHYYQRESLRFSGDAAQINKNLNLFLPELYKLTEGYVSTREKTLDPNEYKSYLMAKREKEEEYLQSFIKSNKPGQTLIDWANYFIDYSCGSSLLHYVWYHPFSKGKHFEQVDTPKKYYSFLDQLELNNEAAIICTKYYRFLDEHYGVLYRYSSPFTKKYRQGGRKFSKSKNFQSEYKNYLSGLIKIYSGFAREDLLSKKLYDLMEVFDRIDVFEKLYPKYEMLLNEHFRKVLTKKYTELKLA